MVGKNSGFRPVTYGTKVFFSLEIWIVPYTCWQIKACPVTGFMAVSTPYARQPTVCIGLGKHKSHPMGWHADIGLSPDIWQVNQAYALRCCVSYKVSLRFGK